MQSRTRDSRWLALVVLCAGMLMVILDQTIVNVALPAIQTDLGFSASGLAWVDQRVPDRVRRPAAARRPARRSDRPPHDLPRRPRRLHAGFAAVRAVRLARDADRRALHPGRRRRAELRRDPRHDRDAVPRAGRAGRRRSASSRSSPPRARRSACWPAACSPRRWTGTGSSSSTCRSARAAWLLGARWIAPEAGLGLRAGADVPGRGAGHGRADARRLHDRRRPLAAAGRRRRRAAGGASSGARPPPRGRCCRCASCARATSRARTSCRC